MTASLTTAPQTGGYGVVDLSGWFPWCIKHLTHSRWAHAFIILDAADGTILEARPDGSAIGSLSQYTGLPMLFSEPAPQLPVLHTADWLISVAGEHWTGIPYGFLTIADLGLRYSLHWKPRWLTGLVLNEKEMICSQLAAEWGSAYGADWRCGQADEQFVTPGMLGARLAR